MKTQKMGFVRVMAAALAVILGLSCLAGCGKKADNGTASESKYATSKELFDAVYENTAKDFPTMGGNIENPTDNEPGTLDLKDKDTMTNMLLIPEDVQGKLKDAATLFHMMNANTFTGCAVKLDGMSADEAAGKIKEAFKSNQFLCGVPDKIVIVSVGPDLIYFFGEKGIMDEFKASAEKLDGAKVLVEENF